MTNNSKSPSDESKIHPTAVIEKGAELGKGVQVGAYSIVGEHVQLGDHVVLNSHVNVQGRTKIGARTRIWPFASIGTDPQDLKYAGEDTILECGEDNMFREYVNISIGTDGGGGKTVVGNGNLLMMNVHVAHDCYVGNSCILANSVSLAGHIEVANGAVLGGHSAIHQFAKIGRLAMIAGGSIVVKDVPPFVTVAGNHAVASGLNLIGLRRADFSRDLIGYVKSMYKILYRQGLSIDDCVSTIEKEIPEIPERKEFVDFLVASKRGVCR